MPCFKLLLRGDSGCLSAEASLVTQSGDGMTLGSTQDQSPARCDLVAAALSYGDQRSYWLMMQP